MIAPGRGRDAGDAQGGGGRHARKSMPATFHGLLHQGELSTTAPLPPSCPLVLPTHARTTSQRSQHLSQNLTNKTITRNCEHHTTCPSLRTCKQKNRVELRAVTASTPRQGSHDPGAVRNVSQNSCARRSCTASVPPLGLYANSAAHSKSAREVIAGPREMARPPPQA
jgi:hypothetical protein